MFSKIIPSFFTIKEGSTFLSKPLFPQEREDVAGYAIASARVLVSSAKPMPKRGLAMIVYAIELRVFVGNYFNDLIAVLIGHIRIYRHYHISLY